MTWFDGFEQRSFEVNGEAIHARISKTVHDDVQKPALLGDYQASGARGRPQSLAQLLAHVAVAAKSDTVRRNDRQLRHQAQA